MGRERSKGQFTVAMCRNMRGQIQTILRNKALTPEQRMVLIEPIKNRLLLAGSKELPNALRKLEPAAPAFSPTQTANPIVTQPQKPYQRGDDLELDAIIDRIEANRIPDSFPQISDAEVDAEIERLRLEKVNHPDNPADCNSTLIVNGVSTMMAANDPRFPWDAGRKINLADRMRRERWRSTHDDVSNDEPRRFTGV